MYRIWIVLISVVIFCTYLKAAFGFECHIQEESPIGTTLKDALSGRACNIVQMKSVSVGNQDNPSTNIKIKLLPSQKNRISSYFQIVSNDFEYDYITRFDKMENSKFGDLQVKKVLDREALCNEVSECCDLEPFCWFQLRILIRRVLNAKVNKMDQVQPDWPMNIETIRVKLFDINDNAPRFPQLVKIIEIPESAQTGIKIPLPLAVDYDSRINNILSYKIENHDQSVFQMVQDWSPHDSTVNQIYLKLVQALDRENKSSYMFNLIATDKGKPSKEGKLMLEVKVIDTNDNPPVFDNITYVARVKELENVGFLIIQVKASDKDSGENGNILYSFSTDISDEIRRKFHIDATSGWISISELLDYEKVKLYKLTVVARDTGSNPFFTKALVIINVIDCNDNPPRIYLEHLTESGKQTLPEGSIQTPKEYAFVIVTDPDSGSGGIFKCDLEGSRKFELVQSNQLEPNSLKINLISELDYEETTIERIKIICHDLGEPRLTSSKEEEIIVQDINDNSPIFEKASYNIKIDENNQPGFVLMRVRAVDKDSGSNGKVSYSLESADEAFFSIDENTGILRSKISFDRERRGRYQVTVKAVDLGSPVRSASSTVIILISDLNDNFPVFQGLNGEGSYIFQVKENKPPGTVIGKVYAEDPDEGNNGIVVYSFISPLTLFSIDQEHGIIRSNQKLDRETEPFHELLVRVTDKGKHRQENSVTVKISVLDENDNEPRIMFPTKQNNSISISYLSSTGSILAKLEALDNDEGMNALLTFQIVSGDIIHSNQEKLFDIDRKNGDLILQRSMKKEDVGVYVLKVMVSDQGAPALSSSIMFIVNVEDKPHKNVALNSYKYQPNPSDGFNQPIRDESLSTTVILIISIALICIIALVLLSLAIFLCGKQGHDTLSLVLFKRGDNVEQSETDGLCSCIPHNRHRRPVKSGGGRFSDMVYNNSSLLSRNLRQSADTEEGSMLTDKNSQINSKEGQNFQLRCVRLENAPENVRDPKYISFLPAKNLGNADRYTTLVTYKGTKSPYEKVIKRIDNVYDKSTVTPIDPIVYVRCQSSPDYKHCSANPDAETSHVCTANGTSTSHLISKTHYKPPDINDPPSNSCGQTEKVVVPITLSSSKSLRRQHEGKQKKVELSRFPSVPDSLNYLSVTNNSGTSESYDHLSHRLITLDLDSKTAAVPIHRGSFV